MLTPRMGQCPLPGMPWAADTGCFRHPEDFDAKQYVPWVAELCRVHSGLLFATAPDHFGDAVATLAVSDPILPLIRQYCGRAALVAQDGLEFLETPWDSFDVLFLGGTTSWKLGVGLELGTEAKARGKWVHVGRVNSWRRINLVLDRGFDSADGTFLAFGPEVNLQRLLRWLDRSEWQKELR